MKREEFLQMNEPSWLDLEILLHDLEDRRRRRRSPRLVLGRSGPDPARFDALYRLACRHLVLARQRQYGADVVERLNDLALRAYRHLYGARRGVGRALWSLAFREFPATVRVRGRLVAAAALAFAVPLGAMLAAVLVDPAIAASVLDPAQLLTLERIYDPTSQHYARERPSEGDLAMFGYYVWNNVGIAFQTFAGGLLAGVGSLAILLYNGLVIGTSMGYVARLGYGETFYPFIAGHSAFELTGIVLSGAAGLDLGWALLAPGRLARPEALRRAGRRCAVVIAGVFALLVMAAFLEAYWSPRLWIPPAAKYGVGAALWTLTLGWIFLVRPRDGS